jgi:hypothetical protein
MRVFRSFLSNNPSTNQKKPTKPTTGRVKPVKSSENQNKTRKPGQKAQNQRLSQKTRFVISGFK